jgi:dinuclear metal center YbgI/SA1388 family protein
MGPLVSDIIDLIQLIAPLHRAEPWDNCGLQVGDPDAEVRKIAVALDADEPTIRLAAENSADLLVTHHPLIFQRLSSIDVRAGAGKAVAAALAAGISVYSAHTSLDHAPGGTSCALAGKLSLVDPVPLPSPIPDARDQSMRADDSGTPDGIVYFGALPSKMMLVDLARFVRESLGAPLVRCTGDPQRYASRAAVCAGSGGDFISTARSLGADVLITGEARYHAAVTAEESGVALIEAGHYWSELPVVFDVARAIEEKLHQEKWAADVITIKGRDPFSYV